MFDVNGELRREIRINLFVGVVNTTKMANVKVPLSLGQRVWNALSAWTIRNAGYQRIGKPYIFFTHYSPCVFSFLNDKFI